ncbi:unnamed protein product [Trifolium pratense]|uniref:Uncharacterized protein n=1 Tax=Trifolium pratense TaxID=57577 RepID=A0ACB0KZY6_TRIPR|nr:unnamed protein product [Trifolium pratense]
MMLAPVRPTSLDDVVKVVKAANKWPPFAVSVRGHRHSINGQADTRMKCVVVEMGKGIKGPKVWEKEMYVDVWGGELWIDVLKATMEYGLAPMSWTDYLYLSVGGTLSNAGISGQTFNYGPQISNVSEDIKFDVLRGLTNSLLAAKKPDEAVQFLLAYREHLSSEDFSKKYESSPTDSQPVSFQKAEKGTA